MTQKKTSADDERKALLNKLAQGAQQVHANAAQLFEEACLLREKGFLSRALFLHQISMEECAKIELIGAWATSALTGEAVDVARISAAMANHKAKNYTNAYLLQPAGEEQQAREGADWKGAIRAFEKRKADFHRESNAAKNASLYVDFKDGQYSTPQERITAEMVSAIAANNSEFLNLTYLKVEMLSRWEHQIDEVAAACASYKRRLIQLKRELPDDPEQALSTLMEEMVKDATAARKEAAAAQKSTGEQDATAGEEGVPT